MIRIFEFFMQLFHKIFHHGDYYRPHISLIIPFREGDDLTRDRVFRGVLEYYSDCLPEAEIIVAVDPLNAYPFNKSAAINNGVRRSSGDIIAVIDADCYINCDTIRRVARTIQESVENGQPLWCVPYERFYRLNKDTTLDILPVLDHRSTLRRLGDPPFPWELDRSPAKRSTGHFFGALIQIMPREAFDLVNGWDVAFEGWGSEDVSMLYSLDTLYGPHLVWDGPVYHLWHHIHFGSYEFTRVWIGQETPENNWRLAKSYKEARNDPDIMLRLVDESSDCEELRNLRLK